MAVLHGEVFPQEDYSKYTSIEVCIDEDRTGWTIEGVRWETDDEFEQRKTLTECNEYQHYLELKEKFKDIEAPD